MIIKIPAISESNIATVDIWGQKTGTIPLRVTKGKYDGSKEIGSIIARHDGYIIADIYDVEKWLAIKNMIDSGKIKAYPSKCSFGISSFKLGPAILGLICDELNELLD